MDTTLTIRLIRAIAGRFPAVVPHLTGRARWIVCAQGGEYKTYDFFLRTMERLITSVYNNNLGGEFLDIAANLISGQFQQAYNQAWDQSGLPGGFPSYLQEDLMGFILSQYVHIDRLYRDIVDARINETPITPLLARAPMWAQRYTEALNRANHLIALANGGLEVWVMNPAKENCTVCRALNGIVAYAQEWQMLNVHPQHAPNWALSKDKGGCGGWNCGCEKIPTEKRRTDRAFEKIRTITGG